MTTKNVQLKDMDANLINPATLGSLVFNTDGTNTWNLGGVEAGAEVNIIEDIKVNGTSLTVSNKEVNVEIAAHKAYSVESTAADTGYLNAFQLTADGQAISGSVKVNIAKDIVLQSGTVVECSSAGVIDGQSVPGAVVGHMYMHMILANADSSHLFVDVTDLVDVYTDGTGIDIVSNEIAIDSTVATLGNSLSHYGITDCYTKDEMDAAFGDLTYEELT